MRRERKAKAIEEPKPPRIVGYLRVSTNDQDLEKNKADILAFANERKLVPVEWVEEKASGMKSWRSREIARAVEYLSSGDWLITPETLNGTIESKVFLHLMSLFSEIERDLISARTKEALKARKAQGVKLGRPKGPGKSRLDQYRPEIEALLKNGSTKAYIARRYKVSEPTMFNWLKKNKIDIKAQDLP
ncbi:MAG: recombinase family protein [Syntrophobacteraceae bacterium]